MRGKKRLQKFAFLLQSIGASCDAEFRIWDFGPYSKEIAGAAEQLSFFGLLSEAEEQVGQWRMFTTVYTISDNSKSLKLEERYSRALENLDKYSNVDLEVAATIQYYLKLGLDKLEAVSKTTRLKPTKSVPEVVNRSFKIIQEIESIN